MDIHNMLPQFWEELTSRSGGPLALRFVLQPLVASALAIRDGIKDDREHRAPYLWTILRAPGARKSSLQEGLSAVSRALILSMVLDLVYQTIVLPAFRPVQTVVIAFTLAFLPYLLVRGPAGRVAHWFRERHEAQGIFAVRKHRDKS